MKNKNEAYIMVKDAVKKYGEGESLVYALDRANLQIAEGEVCVVLGPSGSGKSTLLNMLGGLDSLDDGEICVGEHYLKGYRKEKLTEYRREAVGFVFQFYNLIPDLTVEENIEVVADIAENPLSIDEVLEALDIAKYRTRFPKELSGGQQQRVAIARAMIKNPKLLLCDELTGALDTKSSLAVLKFVEKINKQFGTTIVIITHNEAIANMADRVVRIKDGKVAVNEINEAKCPAEALVL
ncbi:MAG: ABC transporter ATP-binding protein [Lachnospiraceae bacterium]|nr:ABC transporter ATP-binding protein [Lachnospiraceae bacterium]